MDSTPTPTPLLHSQSQCSSPLLYPPPSSATKLPIKRKNPGPINPNPNPNLFSPQLHGDFKDVVLVPIPPDSYAQTLSTARAPPFKYHRVWTEPDELSFLQGLLDCASHGGFSFPKDLRLFYARFSATVSHSYTKSQLSEKLRRLRKKFRVVSSRLARGLCESQLSPHDRALYDLSRKLWSPECWSTSPFGDREKSDAGESDNLAAADENLDQNKNQSVSDDLDVENDCGDEVKATSEMARPIAALAAKSVVDVFDQSLNEVRMVLVQQGVLCSDPVRLAPGSSSSNEGKTAMDFERQWQLQRLAELDVLAQRLRLVLQDSNRGQ